MSTEAVHPAEPIVQAIVRGLVLPERTPLQTTPAALGLPFEEVRFETVDGISLAGWYIPAAVGNDNGHIVVSNHFGPANRAGYPGHLEGFNSSSNIEVDFMPLFKAVHEAGYSQLVYDLRNHGESGAARGGVSGSGYFEWPDVLASLAYVRSRPDTRDKTIQLRSYCMGCNATFHAMQRDPAAFEGVASLVAIQPLVGRTAVTKMLALSGVPDAMGRLEAVLMELGDQRVDDHDVRPVAAAVNVPVMFVQVRNDLVSSADDIQAMHDNVQVADKTVFWIEDTPVRHHGYTHFSTHPSALIEWLDAHRTAQ